MCAHRKSLVCAAALLLAAVVGIAIYIGTRGSGAASTSRAATTRATIATSRSAAARVPGFKMNVQVSSSSAETVTIVVRGDNNAALGQGRYKPGQPFVISNNADGAYTITPEVSGPAGSSTLPSLTVPPRRNATIFVNVVCTNAADCTRSSVSASYR